MNAPLVPGPIEYWPPFRFHPYAHNAKIHDGDQVAKIAAGMSGIIDDASLEGR
ncbi:hypothetical protein [Phaeovulum sp.]|uniref:hypothetical protein n=1 Tax=Phaeovulum sp. TaxID=2934796 RepID=UPI0035681840